jgi:protein-S-isoprenylcysteine O-methyltransferase Ste14
MKSIILKSSFFIYLLIGLEIFIMISPFAVYFYSVYSPVLNLMQSFWFTRWLTEFFLPHFVFLDDLFMKAIGVVQISALLGGLCIFLYAAIPLYYCKFTRRGVATGGLYDLLRHPQYLGFGLAGFGLLLYWPRFFILLMYLTMLFVYYLLARIEEQRMLAEYSESYKAYMARVPMFLPGEIGKKVFGLLFGSMNSKAKGIAALYCLTLVICAGAALLLRQYAVQNVKIQEASAVSMIDVLPESDAYGKKIVQRLFADGGVQARIERDTATLAYVMPSDFFLMALVTDLERLYPPEFEKPAGGSTTKRFFKIFFTYSQMQLGIHPKPHPLKRIIFVSVRDARGRPLRGKDAFRLGARRYAVFHVDMDAASGRILSIRDLKPRNKWGEVPMPVF